jgi:3-hydroxyisobutyrate dehydrogenase-like beta-hydroxyacid dehydrogenase
MTAKLAHQVILCLNMLAAHEGNELARRAGLDPGMLGEAVGAGAAQSRIADRWARARPTVQNGALFRKDLALALELAHELGLELPATALIQQSLEEILVKLATLLANVVRDESRLPKKRPRHTITRAARG